MAIELSESQRQTYLKEEYLFLQAQYEDYDKRSLTIKGWVATGAAGALALSFNSHGAGRAFIPLMTAAIVLVVWYLETFWKLFQYALRDRIRTIESYFRSDPDIIDKAPAPFQIYHAWFTSFSEDQPIYHYEAGSRPRKPMDRWSAVGLQPFICIPYLLILALCAGAAVTPNT